jgi:hypothetical protein
MNPKDDRFFRPPTASELANPEVSIPGWSSPHEHPQVGDVVTDKIHVGIKISENTFISASTDVNAVRVVSKDLWNPKYGRSPTGSP